MESQSLQVVPILFRQSLFDSNTADRLETRRLIPTILRLRWGVACLMMRKVWGQLNPVVTYTKFPTGASQLTCPVAGQAKKDVCVCEIFVLSGKS